MSNNPYISGGAGMRPAAGVNPYVPGGGSTYVTGGSANPYVTGGSANPYVTGGGASAAYYSAPPRSGSFGGSSTMPSGPAGYYANPGGYNPGSGMAMPYAPQTAPLMTSGNGYAPPTSPISGSYMPSGGSVNGISYSSGSVPNPYSGGLNPIMMGTSSMGSMGSMGTGSMGRAAGQVARKSNTEFVDASAVAAAIPVAAAAAPVGRGGSAVQSTDRWTLTGSSPTEGPELPDPTRPMLFKLPKAHRQRMDGLVPGMGGLSAVMPLHPQFAEFFSTTKKSVVFRVMQMVEKKLEPRGLLEQNALRLPDLHLGRILSLGSLYSPGPDAGKSKMNFKAYMETALSLVRAMAHLLKQVLRNKDESPTTLKTTLVKKCGFPPEFFAVLEAGGEDPLMSHCFGLASLLTSLIYDMYSNILAETHATLAAKKFDKFSREERMQRFVSKSNTMDPCGILVVKFDFILALSALECRRLVDPAYTMARSSFCCASLRLAIVPIVQRFFVRRLTGRIGRSVEDPALLTPADLALLNDAEKSYIADAAALEAQKADDSSSQPLGAMQADGRLSQFPGLPNDSLGHFVELWISRTSADVSESEPQPAGEKLAFSEYSVPSEVPAGAPGGSSVPVFSEYALPNIASGVPDNKPVFSEYSVPTVAGAADPHKPVFDEYSIPSAVPSSARGSPSGSSSSIGSKKKEKDKKDKDKDKDKKAKDSKKKK